MEPVSLAVERSWKALLAFEGSVPLCFRSQQHLGRSRSCPPAPGCHIPSSYVSRRHVFTQNFDLIFIPTVTSAVGQAESGWPWQQGVASNRQPPGKCAFSRALCCGYGQPIQATPYRARRCLGLAHFLRNKLCGSEEIWVPI